MACIVYIFSFSDHTIKYLGQSTNKFRFCQKSKKLSCVQKDMLENALNIDLELNDNKTFENIYHSATDCIQHCKANDELVI